MRPIKFRAWQKENKYMTTDISMSAYNGDQSWYYTDPEDGIRLDEHWVLMQFTGLLDKNGKEIYEGDIIRHPEFESESVIFENGVFCCSTRSSLYPFCIYSEVIGNIHENPELLK